MRTSLKMLPLLATLALGGCAGTLPPLVTDVAGAVTNIINTGTIPSINPEIDAKVLAVVTKVQNGAKTVCGFVPLASTVAGIISTFAGVSSIEQAIASTVAGICNAIVKKGARRGGAAPSFRGVAIRGSFQRR